MMKKVLSLLLALGVTVSMSACGSSGSASSGATSSAAASSEAGSSETASTSSAAGGSSDIYPGMCFWHDDDPKLDTNVKITSTDKIKWTIAACLVEDNPQSVCLKEIADDLSKATNGNFTWDIYYNSNLGSESEALELVRNNTAQFVTSNVTTVPQYVDTIGVFALPYLFHSEQDELTYLSTSKDCFALWKQLEDSSNLVTLGFNCSGSRCLSTKGYKQIKAPADLKGCKVRCMEAQVWKDVISALGATPVPTAYTELYTALQTGVVQGQDNPASNTVDGKFYEVLDTFYKTNHCYLCSGYYTNTESWKALPDDYKALLEGLMNKYLANDYHTRISAFTDQCYQTMEKANVKIVEQDQLDMQAFYDNASKMIDEKYMSNKKYADIINDIKTTFKY
ncbi:TRAP transporter substrate-binding protein [Caproiciproducens sp. NJN-50]|uniref:TRAP transporter substrate-binding protein n=1 Tax=Caproiciproducens sp. NJN-50 TaxID=2507162 RepID=UPI000FFE0E1F|nr:TRAP transporter substrate-binding protein [Caproiciproducens sp. NJN-50]QAT50730.1 TRAP transporter substrate-binding protein [Caproiciproducens sp. NJN-50]